MNTKNISLAILFIIIFYFSGCEPKNNAFNYLNNNEVNDSLIKYSKKKTIYRNSKTTFCKYLDDGYGNFFTGMIFQYFDDSLKKVKKIRSRILNQDKDFGHKLSFYNNGKLKTYEFIINSDSQNCFFSYARYYDSIGNITNKYGTPLVSIWDNAESDSISLMFSTFFYKKMTILYSTDKIKYDELYLKSSAWFPLLGEVKIRGAQMDTFYFKINCVDALTNKKDFFLDSLPRK